MSKREKTYIQMFTIFVFIVVLIFAAFILFNNRKKQNKSETIQQRTIQYGSITYITPTILPKVNQEQMIFHHPQGHFSFEYSKDWNLELIKKNFDEPIFTIILNKNIGFSNARIHFMNDVRGLPYFESEVLETKTINNLETKWRTMYKNQKPFEISIIFLNNDFGRNLIGLYLYLPKENQEKFIHQVEEIIASLE
ncbi:MAG TPA: hypothetical protein PLS49_00495 [Candidatus Woesebacteria bacterium]|nr:hypothetical protein [Candidatus Woesebacteria bacterium]